ncbi:MAG: LysM peptidoglycan-binding domain-containing protein [Anaerolineales bacterium]|nr:LysM peptidoglycan-binding domain-containing protein [Anaerolineales bacterium]
MKRILSFGIIAVILTGVLYACNILGGTETPAPAAVFSGDVTKLDLVVQPQSGTFNAAGQTIAYQFTVTNSGTTALTGPVTVADNKMPTVACMPVNTIGNKDNNLDAAESVTCTSNYTLVQADINSGSVINTSTASAGGVSSDAVNTTVAMALSKVLEVTAIANPTTYNQAGQVITLTYTVKNTGQSVLGPAQFMIIGDRINNLPCGAGDTSLTPNQTFTCTATYTTSDADKAANQVVFNTTINGGGATNTQPLSVTVTNTALGGGGTTTGLTPGTTIQHHVNEGEWMIQIARCYGADFYAVKTANPQVVDANKIWPINILTIPNIGSKGKVYGPPCVTYYTAQNGDTWNSIAQKYNADLAVLMEANKGLNLASGVKLKIPLNSANGNPVPVPTADPTTPIRINIPNGSTTVTPTGTIPASKKVNYILAATQGQSLSLKLTAPAADMQLAVTSVNGGIVLKGQDSNLVWSGNIPATGDYIIAITNVSVSDKAYTLEVGLTTPVPVSFERVADINAGAGDSNPSYLAVHSGVLYFNATGNNSAGAELWKYDATTNSTTMVKDIRPGADGSNPAFLASYKGELYFSANGGDGAGTELWRFNGSDAGRLTDINPTVGDANPAYMTVYNDILYFSANGNDGKGVELWKTDGVTSSRVTDINSGAGDSNPSYLAVYNNALFFSATSNDGTGTELWKFDGTNIGRAADINPGVGNSNPSFLTAVNNTLYFSANGGDGSGMELWKFDGTNATRAADINVGAGDSTPTSLAAFNGVLYFNANGNDGAGLELWKFDGTTASRAADINKTGDSFPSFITVYNSQLHFQANGGDGAGKELWKYKP